MVNPVVPAVTPKTEAIQTPTTTGDCSAVNNYDWPVATAYAVCMAESSGNPRATGYNTNGTEDRGLMQINSIHADLVNGDLESLYTPSVNLAIAYKLYSGCQSNGICRNSFAPWSAYNNGNYMRYLK